MTAPDMVLVTGGAGWRGRHLSDARVDAVFHVAASVGVGASIALSAASFRARTGWEPRVYVVEGVGCVQRWLVSQGIAQRPREGVDLAAAQRAVL